MSQAFLPALTRSRGTIVNNVSLAALAPVPFAPVYSISKAAAWSLTQSLRMLLARHGVSVRGVLTGPVDTEMTRGLEIPKASPESVARAIFDGIENQDEDIFPDVLSQALAEGWRGGWPSSSSARTQHCCPLPNPSRADTRTAAVHCRAGTPRCPQSRHRCAPYRWRDRLSAVLCT